MKTKILIYWLLLLFLTSCKNSNKSRVDTLPYYNEATFTPHWISPDNDMLNEFHKISPFKLTNQDGKIITEQTFKDKIYVVDFFFTSCPGICPKMTDNMNILQEEFLKDDGILFF